MEDSSKTSVEKADVASEVEYREATQPAASTHEADEADLRVALRKVDWRLIPLLALLYLLAFLDRGNIGNARTLGMQKELHLGDAEWNISLTIFFIPYALFEVPSQMILKLVRPNIWLACLVVAWGTVTTLSGLVHNYNGLLMVRFFLGITEAGFFPAATYLLTCWYCRYELQSRISLFYCAGTLSGAFSGLLAYAISKMDGVGGLSGWRWIFILEGIITALTGIAIVLLLPNSPGESKFLTTREQELLLHRLEHDGSNDKVQTAEPFQWKYFWAAVRDWKIWVSVVIYWGNSICAYGFIYTLPTVIGQLGYTAQIAQLLTIPVYLFAMIITISAAVLSDRFQKRAAFITCPFLLAAVGYIALLVIPHPRLPGLTYGMLYVVAAGLYPTICGVISWNANNLAGSWKRSIGMAIQNCFGTLGGAVGSNIYLARQAPHYYLGYGFSLAMIAWSVASSVTLQLYLSRENKRRNRLTEQEVREKYTEEQLMEMGDRSPLFRYTT